MRLKEKYQVLIAQLLLLLLLLLKIKYQVLVIQVKKKTGYNTKIKEIENKFPDHDHDKYITTPEFNKLRAENFLARFAKANLATKSDIANCLNKTDFDDKLKNLNKKVTSNKTKYVEAEKKITDLTNKVT